VQRSPMNLILFAEDKQSRYEEPHGELDERGIVRQGNTAYAAALGLLMAGDPAADEGFRDAAERLRESRDAREGVGAARGGGVARGLGSRRGPGGVEAPDRGAEGVAARTRRRGRR